MKPILSFLKPALCTTLCLFISYFCSAQITAVNDTISIPINNSFPFDLSVTDNDLGFFDPLTLAVIEDAKHGTTFPMPDGSIEYISEGTKPADFRDSLRYTISNSALTITDTAWLIITFYQTLFTNDDYESTIPDIPVDAAILANDFDSEGADFSLLGIYVEPLFGSVEINPEGTITYTPEAGTSGGDRYDYVSINEYGATDTASVFICVYESLDVSSCSPNLASVNIQHDSSCSETCEGEITLLIEGGTLPYIISWDEGVPFISFTGELSTNNLCPDSYNLFITDAIGFNLSETIEISSIDDTCIYPGDANSDGIANNFDVLNIGLTYGFTGPSRVGPSSDWIPQNCSNWSGTFTDETNHKHADCDGNGLVESSDLDVVSLNYGSTHGKTAGIKSLGEPIYFELPDTIHEGETLEIPVYLGTEADPIEDFYGIAFSIEYPADMVVEDSVELNPIDSWMGSTDELLFFQQDFPESGRIEAAVTRTDFETTDGWGPFCTIGIVIIDNIDGKDELIEFILQSVDIKAINFEEEDLEIGSSTATSLILSDHSIGITPTTHFNVYPNPAHQQLHIQLEDTDIDAIQLYHINGQLVQAIVPNTSTKIKLNTAHLANGLYVLNIQKGTQTCTQQIAIIH